MIPLGAGRTLRDAPEVFVAQLPGAIRVGFWSAARASHDLATLKSPGCEPATIARATQPFVHLIYKVAPLHRAAARWIHPLESRGP